MKKRKVEEQIFKHYRKEISKAFRNYQRSKLPFKAFIMQYGTVVGENVTVQYRMTNGQTLRSISGAKVKRMQERAQERQKEKKQGERFFRGIRQNENGVIRVVIDHENKIIQHSYLFGPLWGMGEEIPFYVKEGKVVIDHKKRKMTWVS